MLSLLVFIPQEACYRVKVGNLRIGGVALLSWISFAITALIKRKTIKGRPTDASGVASEGSSLVRQNVFPAGLEVPINLKHNSAENASFSVKKAQASRCAPPNRG